MENRPGQPQNQNHNNGAYNQNQGYNQNPNQGNQYNNRQQENNGQNLNYNQGGNYNQGQNYNQGANYKKKETKNTNGVLGIISTVMGILSLILCLGLFVAPVAASIIIFILISVGNILGIAHLIKNGKKSYGIIGIITSNLASLILGVVIASMLTN